MEVVIEQEYCNLLSGCPLTLSISPCITSRSMWGLPGDCDIIFNLTDNITVSRPALTLKRCQIIGLLRETPMMGEVSYLERPATCYRKQCIYFNDGMKNKPLVAP